MDSEYENDVIGSILKNNGYKILHKVKGHDVYEIKTQDNVKCHAKYIHENFVRYKIWKSGKIRFVPKLIEIIELELDGELKGIFINQYIESSIKYIKNINVKHWMMNAIKKLHDNGYIHGDVIEPENIRVDYVNEKVLFIDINDTFHINEIGIINIDDIYENLSVDEMMNFGKRVCCKRFQTYNWLYQSKESIDKKVK